MLGEESKSEETKNGLKASDKSIGFVNDDDDDDKELPKI